VKDASITAVSNMQQWGSFGRYSASGRLEFWHNFPVVLLPSDVFCRFWKRSFKSGQIGLANSVKSQWLVIV